MKFTRTQIADHYNIKTETLAKLLVKEGIKSRKKLSIEEVRLLEGTLFNPIFFKVTRLKLANGYAVHPETLSKILKGLGINHKGKLSIEELKTLYRECGVPKSLTTSGIPKLSEMYS